MVVFMKSLAVTLAEENFSHVFSTLLETACIVCGGWVSVWPKLRPFIPSIGSATMRVRSSYGVGR